jgi:hypothetical protein
MRERKSLEYAVLQADFANRREGERQAKVFMTSAWRIVFPQRR